MKKLVFIALILLAGFSANAQGNFRGEIGAGLPIGDAGDFTSFAISVDLGYLFEISDNFEAGVTTGYTHAFGKDNFDDFQFIPISGSLYFDASEDISIGGDVGYAINVGTGGGGDLYFRPVFVYNLDEDDSLTASFRTVSGDGASFSWLGVGYRRTF